jgi:hypothetical protein
MLAPPVDTNPGIPLGAEGLRRGAEGRGIRKKEVCRQRAPLESSPRSYLRVRDDMGEVHLIKSCGASDSIYVYPGAPNPERFTPMPYNVQRLLNRPPTHPLNAFCFS